ncbi:MAG: putative DNA-binding domain-containing protein [Pseudomonadota bacterium]
MHAPPDPLAEHQRAFVVTLLQAAPSPDRRIGVYRNNVHASLVAALAARFPVVQRLVGEEFFEATAVLFIRRQPPSSPVLSEYGAGFAAFLAAFEPAAGLPYLPDVARLEWAYGIAYHAADGAPVGIERLTAVPAERLDATGLRLHPATGVVASPWPIVSIWTTNTHDSETRRIGPDVPAETALVTRPRLDVQVRCLPPGGDIFVDALADGHPLGEAAAAAAERTAGFDLPAMLAVLFDAGAVADLT